VRGVSAEVQAPRGSSQRCPVAPQAPESRGLAQLPGRGFHPAQRTAQACAQKSPPTTLLGLAQGSWRGQAGWGTGTRVPGREHQTFFGRVSEQALTRWRRRAGPEGFAPDARGENTLAGIPAHAAVQHKVGQHPPLGPPGGLEAQRPFPARAERKGVKSTTRLFQKNVHPSWGPQEDQKAAPEKLGGAVQDCGRQLEKVVLFSAIASLVTEGKKKKKQ
jgi:hypothetical protein